VLTHLDQGLTHGILSVGQHHTLLKGEEVEQVVNGDHDLWTLGGTGWSKVGLFLVGDVKDIVRAKVLLAVRPDPFGLLAPPMADFTEG
jgi:hypothetical protein